MDGPEGLFPETIRERMERQGILARDYQEVRLRVGKGVVFCLGTKQVWLEEGGGIRRNGIAAYGRERYRMTADDMELFLAACSEYSLYAFSQQMKNGYLTVQGGHRVGFGGSLYTENGEQQGFLDIGSANLRIAHEVKGCADTVADRLFENGCFCSTLILSPPGGGKTTLLRDLIRLISDGSSTRRGLTVSVCDERGELAACRAGCPQMDLGENTDILDGGSKEYSLWLMLRSMNPEVLAVDEIGSEREAEALRTACRWGVGVLASMHGNLRENNLERFGLNGMFDRLVETHAKAGSFCYHVTERGREQ